MCIKNLTYIIDIYVLCTLSGFSEKPGQRVMSSIEIETTGGAVCLGSYLSKFTGTQKHCLGIFSKSFSFTGWDRINMLKRHEL